MLKLSRLFISLIVLSASLAFTACGGGSAEGTGTIQVGVTDAPIDNADAVIIFFNEATLHGPNGDIHIKVYDPDTGLLGRSIDLLQLQGGMWTGLFDDVVVAGHYSWIRLNLDLSRSYIQIGGEPYALRCTSCENSSFRLNRSFDVATDGVMSLMLDFDLRKSITDPTSGADYILRPTVRVVETAASGDVMGEIDQQLITDLGGYSGCSVYAFTGNDAVADDIYIPVNMIVPEGQNNPVSTARVMYDNNIYYYTLSYLPAGEYTLALTCDADMDSASTDDVLMFSTPINVTVIAGDTSNGDMSADVTVP
ncbi:MAG: DUF4382 domain-containing protein [Thioalkalispiraceae bacterium]|jgi:hypothetical protein